MNLTVVDETTFLVASVTLGGMAQNDRAIAFDVLHHYLDTFKERLDVMGWLVENTPGYGFEATGPGYEGPSWEVCLRFKTPADACAFKIRWM